MTFTVKSMTNRYSSIDAFVYDSFVAPAVFSNMASNDGSFSELVSKVPEGARVLDIGCGGGHLILALAEKRPDVSFVGVDLSQTMIDRAKRRLVKRPELRGRVEFLVADALELPFEKESFDFVLSIASLKHWPDRARGIEECCRVLAPSGQMVLVEIDRGCSLESTLRFVSSWSRGPAALQKLQMMYFRTFVAGQSIDLEEAREMAASAVIDSICVERVPRSPMLIIRAAKSASARQAVDLRIAA